MEKCQPHYDLKAIVAQMVSVDAMNLTQSAAEGIKAVGMKKTDALEVVQGLSGANFYKSMTSYEDHKVWQDVYHAEWRGKELYLKFQQVGEYYVISFKER